MEHYIGPEAILIRLGYKPTSYTTLYRLIAKERFPCFKKIVRVKGRPPTARLYSNEQLIAEWERRKANDYFEAKHGSKPLPKYLQNASDRRDDLKSRDGSASDARHAS